MQSEHDPNNVPAAVDYLDSVNDAEFLSLFANWLIARARANDDPEAMFKTLDEGHDMTLACATAAFRAPDMLTRSIRAATFHLDRLQNRLLNERSPSYEPAKVRGRERFRELVGRERNELGARLRAANLLFEDRADFSPQPRVRAMKRLWQLALQGDVPAGTAKRLEAEERERDAEARRQRREARRDERKDTRRR